MFASFFLFYWANKMVRRGTYSPMAFTRGVAGYKIKLKKANLNFSLMNKMALRRVSRLYKLIFFNYRWTCEIWLVEA